MGRDFRHILAVGTAACAVAAVATGGWLTSANVLQGWDVSVWKQAHRGLGAATAAGAVALAFLVSGPLRWWLIGSVAAAAIPGGMLEGRVLPHWAGVLHAVAASALTSICAVAVLHGAGAEEGFFSDDGSPSLRTLAAATWGGLLLQTALGALYRHQIVGLLPHIAGALLVMGMVMFAGIAAFSTEGAPAAVKRPAMALLVMTGVQMLLGLGAYLYRMEFREQATGESAMLTFTVIHVAVGALTTACSALMGIQISRYVRPAVAVAP
jgi:hypothetical protein